MKRVFLTFALILLAAVSALATDINISNLQITSYQPSDANLTLRIYYSDTFVDSNGVTVVGGAIGSANFYKSVTCSNNTSTKVVTCPASGGFILPSTTDSSKPNVRVSGALYAGSNQRAIIFTNFMIPTTYGTAITYSQLNTYNQAQPRPLADRYATVDEVGSLINTAIGTLNDASDVIKGRTKLSVPAADSSNPVAVGKNDLASTSNAGVVTLSTDGETTAGEAVQGNDSRLAAASTTNRGTVTMTATGSSSAVSSTDTRVLEEISLSRYASLSAAATAAGSTKQLVIDAATAPGSNLDLSGVVLRFANGGAINPTTGITITLGVITAPRVQIFGGAGSVVLSKTATVYPEWFGVKADAYTANDGAISSSSTTFSSASHPASSSDANKKVLVYGAGAVADSGVSLLNGALRTSVASISGSDYVLASSASATVSGAYFAIGTDNTSAFQKMFDSLPSVSMVHIAPGKYMLGSLTVPSGCTIYASPNTVTIFSTSNSMFIASSKNNVTIDGITIDAGGNPTGNGGVTLVGGTTMTNFLVQNSAFVDTFLTGNVAPVSTFNRHGVLARDYTNFKVLNSRFENGLRIKGAGSANQYNAEIAYNTFDTVNENGVSFLDATATGQTWNVSIHHNKFKGIMVTGNCIVLGDDGFSINVSAGSNASPAVLTTTTNHNLTTGMSLYFYGFDGGWTSLNGNVYAVTVLSSTTFSIPVDSTAFGAFTGTFSGTSCTSLCGRLGATQQNYNFDISNNEFRGSLPANTAYVQNRGAYVQKNFSFSSNLFINEGSSLSATLAINSAQQSTSNQPIINFEAIGNIALGSYGLAAFRLSGINGGVVALNQAEQEGSNTGLRMGTLTNVTVSRNRVKGFTQGIFIVDGTLSNAVFENNLVQMPSANNVVGIYLDTQTNTITSLTVKDNNVNGSGAANTNNYGIQDGNNNNGKSDAVKYIRNDIQNIDTTSGLGSSKYRTLPTHALVVPVTSSSVTTLTNNSATPSVLETTIASASNTNPTTITNLLNGYVNQVVQIVFTNGNTTVQNNSNIQLAEGLDFTASTNDSLTLVMKTGNVWQQVARTTNNPTQKGVLQAGWTTGFVASSTKYVCPGIAEGAATATLRTIVLPATRISYLSVSIGGNQHASGSMVVTLMKNGVATALTVTIPAGSSAGAAVTDSTHSVTGAAGDKYSFQVVNNAGGGPTANDVSVSAVMN
jgi:hypothetical protein